MMNAVHELLTRAQDVIRDPANWIQGEFAIDATGHIIAPEDEGASCFCSLGALMHAEPVLTDTRTEARRMLTHASRLLDHPEIGIPEFNDNHTHAEVMAMWDKAKELANACA